MNLRKKLLCAILLVLVCFGLVACTAKTFVVKFNSNGGSEIADIEVEKDKLLTLPTEPTKEGYDFAGWYTDTDLTKLFNETDTVIMEEITLYAKWIAKEYTVTFIHGDNKKEEVKVTYGNAATAPTPDQVTGKAFTGWDKDFSSVKENMTVNAKYSDASYTYSFYNGEEKIAEINVGKNDNLSEVPAVPEVAGKVGYWDTNELFNVQSDLKVNCEYVDIDAIETIQTYEYSQAERINADKKILRWVFFAGEEYPLSSFDKEIIGPNSVVKIENDKLVAVGVGTFYLKLTTKTGEIKSNVYIGEVMPNVYSFTLGENLNDYLSTTKNIDKSNYLNKTEITPYQVGNANAFKLDLKITDSSLKELENVLLNYRVYTQSTDQSADNKVERPLSDVATITEEGFIFKEEYIGYTITLEASPKYAPVVDTKNPTTYSASVSFVLNDGVNVYTDADLKAAYSDLEVTMINIHSTIECVLNPEQLNPNGTPKNYSDVTNNPDNGNVYSRIALNTTDNHLVINGNYFTIDGTDLPVMKPAETDNLGNVLPEYVGQAGEIYGGGIVDRTYTICSVQTGIFLAKVIDDAAIAENGTANNSVTYNNMTVLGNTKTPEQNFGQMTQDEIQQQIAITSENSGGFNGICARECEAYTNNVVVGYTTYGFFCTRISGRVYLDYTNVYSCWANCMYGWGAHLFDVKNSLLRNSGGVAVQMDDCFKELASEKEYYDPRFIMDENTVVDNYITGEEPWFKAFGLSTVAPVMKGQLEQGFSQLTQNKFTIVKKFITENVESEMVNLVFFSRPNHQATDLTGEDALNYGGQVSMVISGMESKHAFNFLKTDLRAQALGGQYFGLCGYDNDGVEFGQTVQYLMSQGRPQTEAITMALANQYVTNGLGKGYLEIVTEMPKLGQVTIIASIHTKSA